MSRSRTLLMLLEVPELCHNVSSALALTFDVTQLTTIPQSPLNLNPFPEHLRGGRKSLKHFRFSNWKTLIRVNNLIYWLRFSPHFPQCTSNVIAILAVNRRIYIQICFRRITMNCFFPFLKGFQADAKEEKLSKLMNKGQRRFISLMIFLGYPGTLQYPLGSKKKAKWSRK